MKRPRVGIILANLMNNKGELNAETKARISLAAKLDSELQSDVVLLCGWAYRHDCSLSIADAMKAYISTQFPGLAKKAVCQKHSRDTVGDAVFTRLYLRELFINRSCFNLNVITSEYHTKRTQEIFEFIFGGTAFIDVKGALGFDSEISATKEIESLEAFRKTFYNSSAGDLSSIYIALANNHPFYNGAIYPLIEDMSEASWNIRRSLASL